jgi:hypothetical protein
MTSKGEMVLVPVEKFWAYKSLQTNSRKIVEVWQETDRSANDWVKITELMESLEMDVDFLNALDKN